MKYFNTYNLGLLITRASSNLKYKQKKPSIIEMEGD